MSWERNLIRLYMRSLDEQTEWVFKIQTTLLMVASTTLCGNHFFKQSFRGQSLQQGSPCDCNMRKCTLYPFLWNISIRE